MSSPIQLPPPPYRSPFLNQATGLISDAWQKWIQQLFQRVGGTIALSNPQITKDDPAATTFPGYIPSTQTTIYTTPTGQTTLIDSFSFNNVDVGQRSVSLYIVAFGDVPDQTNLLGVFNISPKSTIEVTALKSFVLPSDYYLSAIASASDVISVQMVGRLVA